MSSAALNPPSTLIRDKQTGTGRSVGANRVVSVEGVVACVSRYRRSRMRWICATTRRGRSPPVYWSRSRRLPATTSESGISFSRAPPPLASTTPRWCRRWTRSIGRPDSSIGRDILRPPSALRHSRRAVVEGEPLRADRKIGAGAEPVVERRAKGIVVATRQRSPCRYGQANPRLPPVPPVPGCCSRAMRTCCRRPC